LILPARRIAETALALSRSATFRCLSSARSLRQVGADSRIGEGRRFDLKTTKAILLLQARQMDQRAISTAA